MMTEVKLPEILARECDIREFGITDYVGGLY